MAKVLFVIMSADEKMDLALTMASKSVEGKRFEDLKIIFWGPSEGRLLRLSGSAREFYDKLASSGAIDSACVFHAENKGIKDGLSKLIRLMPAGERIAHYINSGYNASI